MEELSVEEPRLVKGMSAVSFRENTVVFNIDTHASPKLDSDTSDFVMSLRKAEKGNLFRTILKRSLPKIKCISTFCSLHENVQQQEKLMKTNDSSTVTEEIPVEMVLSRCNSRLKSARRRKSQMKRPKTSTSLSSSLTTSSSTSFQRPDVIKSLLRPEKKVDRGTLKKAKKSQKSGNSKRKDKSYMCDPVIINTCVNHHENVTPGTLECQKLHQTLAANGVTISLYTLKRALLPPAEIRNERYELNYSRLPSDTCSRLLSHPSAWLPKEYARLKSAKKRLEEFDEETIRKSTVITSDDEDDTSTDEDIPKRSTNSSRLYYNAFARTVTSIGPFMTQKSRSSIKDLQAGSSSSDRPPALLSAAKIISKWKVNSRPSTAV